MNLTAPHCGTALSLLLTKAVKQPEGSYKSPGTKISISAAAPELFANILHLPLARFAPAPDRIMATTLFIVPPDVRRMLMSMRAFNEASRALLFWTALQGDIAYRSPDAQARQAADDYMGLLTPVIKAMLTDGGFANAVSAQQVFGGHGYIAETGMEQFVRDARIAMIYEGANGIQALDLVGRKLPKDGGRAMQAFFQEVQNYIKSHGGDDMKPYIAPLEMALGHLQQATIWLMQNALAKPDNAGAGATDYLNLFGLVALGYMWCRMVETAKAGIAAGDGAAMRLNAKLTTGRFFMERTLPETGAHLARIQAGAASTMELPAEMF